MLPGLRLWAKWIRETLISSWLARYLLNPMRLGCSRLLLGVGCPLGTVRVGWCMCLSLGGGGVARGF